MARADNTAHLRQAAAERHEAALHRARNALRSLDKSGMRVTFSTVAERARVSRSWLYRQEELRDSIIRWRSQPPRRTRPVPASRARVDPRRAAPRAEPRHRDAAGGGFHG